MALHDGIDSAVDWPSWPSSRHTRIEVPTGRLWGVYHLMAAPALLFHPALILSAAMTAIRGMQPAVPRPPILDALASQGTSTTARIAVTEPLLRRLDSSRIPATTAREPSGPYERMRTAAVDGRFIHRKGWNKR